MRWYSFATPITTKKIGLLLAVCRFFNRFNLLMWLGRLRLVSDCSLLPRLFQLLHTDFSASGSFQASLLGISVMTGSVTFYFTMQWALSCSHSYYYTEFGYLLLWEDGMACSWSQMFATRKCKGKVFCGSGLILFVIASFMSLELDISNFSCTDFK